MSLHPQRGRQTVNEHGGSVAQSIWTSWAFPVYATLKNQERLPRVSWRVGMVICDLCGEAKECLQKEIEGKEYAICSECWKPFAQRLMGKVRTKNRETVFLPPPRTFNEREDEE